MTQQQAQANEEEQLNGEQVIKGEADLGKERLARLEIYKYSTVNQGIWFKNAEMRDTTALDAEVESMRRARSDRRCGKRIREHGNRRLWAVSNRLFQSFWR